MQQDLILKQRFNKAVRLALDMQALPPDVMLEFYAYYKQATNGDNFSFNANIESDVRNTFKFNAWMQLRGISPEQAQEEYIKLVEKYTQQKI